MPGYLDVKRMVDAVYGAVCQDCGQPADTYYIDPDNPEKPNRKGRYGYEFYEMVIRQNYPSTVLRLCRRHYLNRYQNDRRRRAKAAADGPPQDGAQ